MNFKLKKHWFDNSFTEFFFDNCTIFTIQSLLHNAHQTIVYRWWHHSNCFYMFLEELMQRRMQTALIDWSIGGIWCFVRLNNFLLSPIACEILTIGAFNRQLSFSTWNAMTKSDSIPFEIICNVTFLLIALACVFPWLCLLKLLSMSIFYW